MQVMNSQIKPQDPEYKLFAKAQALGLPVNCVTLHDGPDSYERIVIETENTRRRPDNRPVWRWSDVVDNANLLAQVQKLDPTFQNPWSDQ